MDSHATVAASPMVTRRACTWCANEFVIVHRPGRPRIYCNHSCRQRAYEHRHGFLHERTLRPLPGQAHGEYRQGTGYERGGYGFGTTKVHAMRTSVRPEGRHRETMCGLLVAPITGRWFSLLHPHACAVCTKAVEQQPLRQPISPSNELSRLRAVLVEAHEQRHDPAAAIDWMHANRPMTRGEAA